MGRKAILKGMVGMGEKKQANRTSSASLYIATCVCRPVRLKSSSINSSETSAKYSCPMSEQKLEIHDSGTPDDEDISPDAVEAARLTECEGK
jgi:hypothetical protein